MSSTLLALIFTTWGHGVILKPHTVGVLTVGQVVLFYLVSFALLQLLFSHSGQMKELFDNCLRRFE